MKIKISIISILITILLIGVGVYFISSINKVSVNSKEQNDKSENTDPKARINDNLNAKAVSPLTHEDFVIKDTNNYIELGGQYNDLKTNEKIIKNVPANEKYIYDIYEFDNFKILTQPGEDANSIIASIDLTSPIIHTLRGIGVGDTISEVIEKYGKQDSTINVDSVAPGQNVYIYNGEQLTFFVDKNEKVVLIRFEII